MTTKLTLSIDSKVIDEAKRYSKRKGVSISKLVEQYLNQVSKNETGRKKGSAADELVGLLGKAPKNFDYKTELMKILEEKYLPK